MNPSHLTRADKLDQRPYQRRQTFVTMQQLTLVPVTEAIVLLPHTSSNQYNLLPVKHCVANIHLEMPHDSG